MLMCVNLRQQATTDDKHVHDFALSIKKYHTVDLWLTNIPYRGSTTLKPVQWSKTGHGHLESADGTQVSTV